MCLWPDFSCIRKVILIKRWIHHMWLWLIVKDQLQSYEVTANKIVLLLIYSIPHKIDRWSVDVYFICVYYIYLVYMYILYIWFYILYVFVVPLANVITDYLDIWNQFNNLLNCIWLVIIWLNDFSGFGCQDCQWSWHGKLNWEDYFPMDCFSREGQFESRGKYLVKLIIKTA